MSPTSRIVFKLPRNGTSSHSVDTSSATNLYDGATFTPEDDSLLLAFCYGAVTADTPSGWELVEDAVNNGGLYVWQRRGASGSNSFTISTGASNYALGLAVYEFPASYDFVSAVSATNMESADPNPNLTGLSGTNLVLAARGGILISGATLTSIDWTGDGSPVEDFEVSDVYDTTTGYAFSVASVDGYTGASWQPTATVTRVGGSTPGEGITLALASTTEPTQLEQPEIVITDQSDPTTPGGSDGTATVEWDAIANADHYEAGIADGYDQTGGFATVSSSATSPFQFTGISAGDYTLAIRAMPAE